jgi:hypothetical protein
MPCPECSPSEAKSDGAPDPNVQGSGTADGRSADDYLVSRMAKELLGTKRRAAADERFAEAGRALMLAASGATVSGTGGETERCDRRWDS